MLGDKVHRPPDRPDFHPEAMRSLRETEGLRWHGALPRSAVHGRLAACDIALSIRDPGVEASRELSTKVLEYGAAGLPVVLNRAPAYERLLGEDYPFFIDSPHTAAELLTGPALDPELRAAAGTACQAASHHFTFSRVAARLAEHLPEPPRGRVDAASASFTVGHSSNGSTPRASSAPRVLVAGHDLKFLGPIREAIASAGATLTEDIWRSHTEHDEAASRAALEEADVILCEWCLGNAVWYSRNKRPDQRLVIRLHRVEVYTDHPAAVEIDNVDQIVCVSQHIADEAVERFGWNPIKLRVIPNSVDVDRFRLPKEEGARFTLGMIGYVPKRKRLDLALDILEELRSQEPHFRLMLIGHPPSELDWVTRNPDEVDFFRGCFLRIQRSPDLRGAVSFHPFTDNLPTLFQGVGFAVSTSDSEGHQVALAEAAASGAVPVVLDRPGVADQYPKRWIHATPADAATRLLALSDNGLADQQRASVRHVKRWSLVNLMPEWRYTLTLEKSVESPS